MSTLDDALCYALQGWSVIPCHTITDPLTVACSCGKLGCTNPGKHPRISWTQYQGDRPTEKELSAWLRRWPDTNIGAVTGAVSGLVVLDVDPAHGGDESLRDLIAAHGDLPDTVRDITGSGGQHYFWRHPGGKIQNEASYSLGQGLDIRGDGGFVVLPPSLHASGRRYEWEVGCAPWDRSVEPMPGWLLDILRSRPGRSAANGNGGSPNTNGKAPLNIEAYLTGDALIPVGEQNLTLTRLAGYHLGKGDPEEHVVNVLERLYLPRCPVEAGKEPFSHDDVVKIVQSIARAESRRRAAVGEIESGNGHALGADELTEAARGIWAGLGVEPVSRFILQRSSPDVVEYIIELPESEVSLGDNLLDQNRIRKALLNSDAAVAPPRRKDEHWAPLAVSLRRCAIEVVNGPRRHVDQLTAWVLDWLAATKREWIEVGGAERRDFLAEGPCLIDGRPTLRSQPFLEFLTKRRYAPALTMPGLSALLVQGAWVNRQVRLGAGARDVFRVWAGPDSILSDTADTA